MAGGGVEDRRAEASYAVRAGLIALMLVGALALWIGDPVLWMWITSRLQSGTQAKMGPYALALVGIVLTAVVIGKALSRLNRFYGEATGTAPTVKIVVPWRRWRRGSSSSSRRRRCPEAPAARSTSSG